MKKILGLIFLAGLTGCVSDSKMEEAASTQVAKSSNSETNIILPESLIGKSCISNTGCDSQYVLENSQIVCQNIYNCSNPKLEKLVPFNTGLAPNEVEMDKDICEKVASGDIPTGYVSVKDQFGLHENGATNLKGFSLLAAHASTHPNTKYVFPINEKIVLSSKNLASMFFKDANNIEINFCGSKLEIYNLVLFDLLNPQDVKIKNGEISHKMNPVVTLAYTTYFKKSSYKSMAIKSSLGNGLYLTHLKIKDFIFNAAMILGIHNGTDAKTQNIKINNNLLQNNLRGIDLLNVSLVEVSHNEIIDHGFTSTGASIGLAGDGIGIKITSVKPSTIIAAPNLQTFNIFKNKIIGNRQSAIAITTGLKVFDFHLYENLIKNETNFSGSYLLLLAGKNSSASLNIIQVKKGSALSLIGVTDEVIPTEFVFEKNLIDSNAKAMYVRGDLSRIVVKKNIIVNRKEYASALFELFSDVLGAKIRFYENHFVILNSLIEESTIPLIRFQNGYIKNNKYHALVESIPYLMSLAAVVKVDNDNLLTCSRFKVAGKKVICPQQDVIFSKTSTSIYTD